MKNSILAIALFLSAIGASSPVSASCTWQSISVGETKSGTLATDDCVDFNSNGNTYYYDQYSFTGTSGQQISILNTSSVIDPDLLLIYPDGTTTSYDDDGGGGTTARIPPTSGYKTLTATGTYSIIASSSLPLQTGAYTLTLSAASGGSSGKTTAEFYNTTLRHYFVTASASEAAGIESGAAGAGWVRTGHSFKVDESVAGAVPVCRFYGTPGVGPNSHFYTADAGECELVKKDPGWFYEGIAFEIQPAQGGNCPVGTQPIYRAYNSRWMFNDSNHRFITNYATYLQMGNRGWSLEGMVMCSTGILSPTGVTGGIFNDPSGAGVTVIPGEIPSSLNATQPAMTPSPSVPSDMTIDPSQGDVNVTRGAPAYDFNLTGDGGFTTTTAGAVTISLPFDTSLIPSADRGDTLKIFVRIFNPQDGSQIEVTGDISGTGSSSILTVETRGLPLAFTAIVIYNPNMEAVTSEEATVLDTNSLAYSAPLADKAALTAWPAQSWCVIYNLVNPNLITAVKNVLGLAGNPSRAQIRGVVLDKVGGGARKSQTIYQTDGLNGPNMYIGRTACRDNVSRYNIHLIDSNKGAHYRADDPNEWENPTTDNRNFGRLYMVNSWLDGHIATVLDIIAHEMLHGIQDGYQIWGFTPKGYKEGSAATYGRTIDKNQVITVRSETLLLSASLMSPNDGERYNNEDFFAYVGKQYNVGSLNYMSGLYAQMHATIGAGVNDPSAATMYGAMNTYFNAKFAQPLQTVYLDFVKQRALNHNASSQFGRPGEVVSGFAEGLFGATSVYKQNVNLASCNKVNLNWAGIAPFSTRAIVVNPIGVLPADSSGLNLVVKITPSASSVGALWNGFTYRTTTTSALAANNKFPTFGKLAGDQVVVLVSNLDPANTGTFNFEIGCEGPTITTLSPVKGPVDTSVTITGSGFGTAVDTRSVSFNGLKASNVTWNSDTVAVAKVPPNASTGDVIVEVNTVKSNGVNFEVVAQCSSTQNAGADTPDTRSIELGKSSGQFDFSYNTYSQKDQILVKYQGTTLFDTGCVGTSGTKTLNYNGSSTQITVQVIPNCAGGSGTAWDYSVACPK
jgi:hypothetical protein